MVPLAQLIDERARALLEESKAAERRAEEEQQVQARLDALQASVERARAALDAHWMPSRKKGAPGVPSTRGLLRMFALLSVTYVFLHATAIPRLGWTPAAWACPLACDQCAASARMVDYPGPRADGEIDEVVVCRNAHVDIDRSSDADLLGGSRLDPYRLSSTTIMLVEGSLWLALMMPLLSLFVRRSGWAQRDELEAKLKEAKAALRAAKQPLRGRESGEPYR